MYACVKSDVDSGFSRVYSFFASRAGVYLGRVNRDGESTHARPRSIPSLHIRVTREGSLAAVRSVAESRCVHKLGDMLGKAADRHGTGKEGGLRLARALVAIPREALWQAAALGGVRLLRDAHTPVTTAHTCRRQTRIACHTRIPLLARSACYRNGQSRHHRAALAAAQAHEGAQCRHLQ
jgi:hypothetical protein